MPEHRIFATAFAKVYPMYVQKAERKNRTKEEVDQIICRLTGFDQAGLRQQIEPQNVFRNFLPRRPPCIRIVRSSRARCLAFAWRSSQIL
jgi:hypothetical protein